MSTLRAGLIGAHISATRLPAALDMLCAEAGWTLDFDLIDTADRAFDFEAEVAARRDAGWTGVTVTHPWKPAARAFAGPDMDAAVSHLGASNLITFAPPRAFNTDYTGTLAALRAAKIAPSRVLVIGAGGVAEAIVPALFTLGASEVLVTDIDTEKARDLAARTGATAIPAPVSDVTGLVNATPVGMAYKPGLPIAANLIGPQSWAFDAVYTPPDTAFLKACRATGLTTLSGFELFRHMAIDTFAAYTGLTPDAAAVDRLTALRP